MDHSQPMNRPKRLRERLAPLREAVRGQIDVDEQQLFKAIATEVAKRRATWGMSQRELAELCGTTQSAIARIERGARPPRIDTLARVASALDCELVIELRPKTLPPTGGTKGEDQ